jgi:hypothetical protein
MVENLLLTDGLSCIIEEVCLDNYHRGIIVEVGDLCSKPSFMHYRKNAIVKLPSKKYTLTKNYSWLITVQKLL